MMQRTGAGRGGPRERAGRGWPSTGRCGSARPSSSPISTERTRGCCSWTASRRAGSTWPTPGTWSSSTSAGSGTSADLAFPPGAPLRVLHLGGGALTLPRYLAHTRPGSRQLVAEVDDALTDLVRAHLPLPPGTGIRVRAADAREVVESVRPGELRPGDRATSSPGAVTPPHLTTAEFAAATARALRPGGVYAVNVAAGRPLQGPAPRERWAARGRRSPRSVRSTARRA